jgi:hypothetical protein
LPLGKVLVTGLLREQLAPAELLGARPLDRDGIHSVAIAAGQTVTPEDDSTVQMLGRANLPPMSEHELTDCNVNSPLHQPSLVMPAERSAFQFGLDLDFS